MIPPGIISADGHVCEPANCYIDHIDPAYRDRMSRTTISLSRKSLAERRRMSLDILERGAIIVARFYGAIASQEKWRLTPLPAR